MKLDVIFLASQNSLMILRYQALYTTRTFVHHQFRRFQSYSNEGSSSISFHCDSAIEVAEVGSMVANLCGCGDVVLLKGSLGAGKSCFARGFVQQKFDDFDMRVTSPSYLLDNTYLLKDTNVTIHHMDLYRLSKGFNPQVLGIPHMFDPALRNICLIEWPQRLESLPTNHLAVGISINDDKSRTVSLVGSGRRWETEIDTLLREYGNGCS